MIQSRALARAHALADADAVRALADIAVMLAVSRCPTGSDETIRLLGDLMIPLMLLALGHTLGGLRAGNSERAFGLGAARLVIALAVAVGVSRLLGLTGIAQGVLILQGTMPAAVFNYLFAARYQRDAEDVAGIVLDVDSARGARAAVHRVVLAVARSLSARMSRSR